MGLDEMIDCRLEHETVVDGYHPDRWLTIPARLATASDRGVHDVVRNEKESLKLGFIWIVSTDPLLVGRTPLKLTNSIHHPTRAALKYSSSVNSRPLRILTESTTDIPRLSFPPRTL